MNGKKIACVVLMLLLAGISYGTQIMHNRSKAMSEQAEIAETDATMAKTAAEVAETNLIKLKYDTEDLRQFLGEWEPQIKRLQTGQEAEGMLQSLLRNSGILTVSQKSEVKENRENKVIPKSLLATLVVQDEYAKTMNWLGELERKMPLARVTSCRLKQGETSRQVNLEIRLELPLINLAAVDDTAPK